MQAPAAVINTPTNGGSFSSCLVSTPREIPPALTPSRSVWGIGNRSDATPRTSRTIPIQNNFFIILLFFLPHEIPRKESKLEAVRERLSN
jgi:hypothetical protein